MILSKRLNMIVKMLDSCACIADIGTDHALVPIYLVQKNICIRAIASDINEGPLIKAKTNISMYGMNDAVECRLGGGLSVLKPGEADCAIIAGMGGYQISDILEEGRGIAEHLDSLIIQPAQNVEIVREYVYNNGFTIADEDLCFEEGKYYEALKINYAGSNIGNSGKEYIDNDIYFEISKRLIERNHPLIKEYINYKINRYEAIRDNMKADSSNAQERLKEIKCKIKSLKELL